MVELPVQGPPEEQNICVTCGFCCDGTLFFHAMLQPGERGSLPEKIEQNYRMEKGKEFFLLPCLYFNEKCTIYDLKRAEVCSGFRCQMLKDFAEGKITLDDALETVREAIKIRVDLVSRYRELSGKNRKTSFKQLLVQLGKMMKSSPKKKSLSKDYEVLLAQCNIFEALLIKHFRSTEDFEKMMTGDSTKDKR
jgi:hypothetical protein